jgi:Collagen triple helix repeat (20 copies)
MWLQGLSRSVLVVAFGGTTAFAATQTPLIQSAIINYSATPNTLTLNGLNFNSLGGTPTVSWGSEYPALVLLQYTSSYILAQIPAGQVTGTTYDVIVTFDSVSSDPFGVLYGGTGPQGPPGTNGNTIWNGTTPPPTTTGVNGDFYLDTATNCLYGPMAGGAWPSTCVTLIGPMGAPGSQGPVGPAGAQGPMGATGPAGPQGSTGATGPQGAPGANGNTVWNGTTPPPSTTGVNGDFYLDTATNCLYGPMVGGAWPTTCLTLVGPVGPTGPQGLLGPAGPQGATGATGPQGPTGATGPQGPTGATGSKGPTGATGPQGPAGTNGNTVWNGTTTPASSTGVNGDFYLDTATHCLYGPKASGAWPTSCVTLVGPTGATGPQGTEGPTGATGPAGPEGPAGPQGPSGSQCTYSVAHPIYGWGTSGVTLSITTIGTANKIAATTFEMACSMTFTKMVVYLATASSGDHVAFSIWDSTGSTKEYANTGPLSTDTTGALTGSFASVTLSPGTYMLEWSSDNAKPGIYAFAVGTVSPQLYPKGSWGTCGTEANFEGTVFPTGCSNEFTQGQVNNAYVVLHP